MTQWIVWPAWLLACIVAFAILEANALRHPDREWTLSHFMADLGANFPLTLVVFGIIVGTLATHFFAGSWNCGGGVMPAMQYNNGKQGNVQYIRVGDTLLWFDY